MSSIQLCLCELHLDIRQNCSNFDLQAAKQQIIQINQYLRSDITSLESEMALKTLFADNKGIISYAKKVNNFDSNNSKIITADILFLILQLIELFPTYMAYYIKLVMDLCIITTKKNATISIKTYQIYEKLLQLSNFSDQIEINKIIEHLDNEVSLGSKITPTVRQHIYNLFGVIAQYHPMYLRNYKEKLINLFCSELQIQIDKKEKNIKYLQPVAIGCLNGLTGFLNNFADCIETRDYCFRLYKILKTLIGTIEENKRHVINRTGLNFFQKHIQLFLKLLFQESSEVIWFEKKLWDWCLMPNLEDKKIGLSSFEVLYKGASIEFTKNIEIIEPNIRNTQQEILKNMIIFLKSKIFDTKLNFQEHAVVIRSIGWLSEPCNNLLEEDNLYEIFTILSLQAEEKYLNCMLDKKLYDPNAANYLNSLSLVVRNLKTINSDQVLFIQRLSIYCFNDFISAQLKSEWKNNISNAIIISIYCLASSHGNILDKYLKQLFYVGLIKSCSHRAAIDSDIVEEYTGQILIKSTNYVPLWISLLKAHQCHSFDLYLNVPILVKSMLGKSLICNFMSSVLKIITKLNLVTNKSTNEFEIDYVASKPSDYTVLINLVQIYSEILDNLELDIETSSSWLPYTLNALINYSIEFPTVSSLYKILAVIFQKLDWCTLLENTKNNSSKEKILEYLKCVMTNVHIFRGDLQICCLDMLLNIPSIIIKEVYITQILDIIKSALIVGSTFLPLAKSAVNALQKWQQDLSKSEMDQLLKYIMPYLDVLLRTKGYDSEVELDSSILDQIQVQNNKKRTLIKQNKLIIKSETELEIVQTQILQYLAQLDMATCLRLLGNSNEMLSFPVNVINYKLSFNDCKINICFDHFLPRILELCQYCSNRQIRFNACETFHTYIILYLGNNLILERSNPTEMEIVTIKIIPVVIKLACDMDNLVQQLFEPLAIGIMHYFASGIQYNSIYTPIVIDILMDSISEKNNEAIRDFSAKCIVEFIHWTLKKDNPHQKPSLSLRLIIKKIKQFCIHSDSNKQIGAAIAFNSCYAILREDETIINELWIQLLYYFILILDSSKSPNSEEHVLKSIDHLHRVFYEKSNLFNEICVSRVIPKTFPGTQLYNVVEWLLKFIGSPITNCRSKCFDMVLSLSKNVKDHNSLRKVLDSFIISHGQEELINSIERDLNSFKRLKNFGSTLHHECLHYSSIIKILINWLNQLTATLDCYTLLFKENIINIKLLKNPYSSLFQAIHHFLLQIEELSLTQWLTIINIPFEENNKDLIIQSRHFITLKNDVIIGLFKFINVSISHDINDFLDDVSSQKIYELAIKNIFKYSNVNPTEKSNLQKTVLVQYIKNTCSLNAFNIKKLKQHLIEEWPNFMSNLNTLSECSVKNNFLCANQLLFECNIISTMDIGNIVNQKYILEVIFKYVYNNGVTKNIELPILSYLENVVNFVINLASENDLITLLILDKSYILDTNTKKKKVFGQYFFSLFNKPITKYFLKNPDVFVCKLFSEYPLNDWTLNVIFEILRSSNNNNLINQGQLIIEKIVTNKIFWKQFQDTFSWNDMYEFVELSSNVVDSFRNENLVSFQKWICENLINNNLNFYHKCRLLGFLPKLVSSQTYTEPIDNSIRKYLIDFRDKYFSGTSSNLKPLSIDFTNLVTTFQKILSAMELSSSYLLFEIIVEWCIKDPKHVCIDRVENSLCYFVKRLSEETQFLCCQFVCEKFRNEIISEDRRQMIINFFLIPIISYCTKSVVLKTYMNIIDFIIKTVNVNLLSNDSGKARHLLISKIGCFKLIEEMFRFFTNTELNNDSIIPWIKIGSYSKNLITLFRTSAVKVRYSNVDYNRGSNEIKELLRQLHCCSYNTLITIISNTDDDLHTFSIFLFNEKKHYIWRNLIDCNVHHEFSIDFETAPQRKKKLINIRKKCNQNKPVIYINLNSHLKNTLIEDLGSYDYNSSYLRSNYVEDFSSPNCQSLQQMLSIELEMDSLNNHECMAHLCAVIKHLTSEVIIDITIKPIIGIPDWMKNLKLAFCDESSDTINSKILILKLIVNCETNFEPYAKHWLGPIMQFVLDKHLGDNLNYFIFDVMSMIISWHNIAVPTTEDEKYLAKKLFSFILSISSSEIKNVFNHNLELIKIIIENWKCVLEIEYDIFLSLVKSEQENNKLLECGLHLIAIVSANGILPFNELNKKMFLSLLMEHLKNKNQVIYILGSEIFGMLLKTLNENSMNETEVVQLLSSVLKLFDKMDTTKVLSCLYHIHKHYSTILDSFMDELFCTFEKLQGCHQTQCLEMFLNRLSVMNNPYKKITELPGFFTMLKDKGTDNQLICLKIILQLIPSLHAEDVIIFIKTIAENVHQNSNGHRKLIYNIMCETYEIYIGTNTETSKQILEDCKKVLINGLMDNDDELRQTIFRFWADDKRLPLKCIDRLLILLDQLYSPDIESQFLGNLICILLESCCTALDYDQNIFQYPLHDCEFEDYKLTLSWRAKNVATIPKYANTIASQLYHSKMFEYAESEIQQGFQTKRTLSFQFSPTVVQTQLTNNISTPESYLQLSINEAKTSLNSSNHNIWDQNSDNLLTSESDFKQKKKVRLLSNKSALSKQCAMKNIQMNVKHDMFKKERSQKRESSVNMYRKYRIGDFPDIQITNASVIKPLVELAKRDNIIARKLLSSIMYEFKNNPKIDQQYFESLNKSLTKMMNYCHCNPSLVGFILDTACCYPSQINLDLNRVTEIATSCGLMSLGALIIENSINCLQSNKIDEHVAKKKKIILPCLEDTWMKLAEIYKHIGELDVVESIFQEKINNLSCDTLKEAIKAEQSDDWRIAQTKFKLVLECNEPNSFFENDKDFLFEEYYKCSENLSDWKEINKMLKYQTGENYENVWNNNRYKKHLLPRILHSELFEILSGMSDGKFIETFSNWLNDTNKEEYLLTHVAAQACMIFLCCDNFNKAQLWCKLQMHNFLKEWENISPQYYKLRADRLLNIQTLSEIYYFTTLSSVQSCNNTQSIRKQIHIWQSKLPTESDSILLWNVKILNRSLFFNKMKTYIDELQFEEKSNLKQTLNKYDVESMLALIESSIDKKNFYVAKKYINEYEFESIENWKSDFILCRSKILAMSSHYTKDTEKKLKYYLNSWSELDDIIIEQCSPICLMKMHLHIASISMNLSNVLRGVSDISSLSNNLRLELMNKIKNNIELGNLDIFQQFNCTIINNLKSGIHVALNNNLCSKKITDTYLRLAQYCLEELNYKENIEDNQKKILFIQSVLKAMKYGARKASELFPIILQFEDLPDIALKDAFIAESKHVPEYMFLQWINQILGCLDSPLITVIGQLLIRISKMYPKAVQLPLRIFMEKEVYNNKQCEEFLKTKLIPLISDIYLDMFIEAISNVCCPFTQLIEYINDIQECIKTNCLNIIVLAFENMFENCFIKENHEFKGKEFKTLDIYKNKLQVILDKFLSSDTNINDSCIALEQTKKQVHVHKEEYYNRKPSTNLINYCPWLAQYSNHNIVSLEIPGQYSGLKIPNPDNHITITAFKPNVQIIYSMRNPMKITMIGNNGEKYSFLIKFGEDLRQDQRIEQLLQVMNNTLCENAHCCKRQLSLLTYVVYPVSKKLGMIEWINNTVTLKDFICESFSDGKESGIKQLHSKVVEHNRWLSEKSVKSNMLMVYAKATMEYNCIVTSAKFKQLVQSIPEDILRKSLLNMCHCAEIYICLRSKFITSYSVLSMCHWLLGIGDRHLNNTIVSKQTGQCIGIDFNFAFHTATSIQVIPELIPFRMSPHIISLMTPLNLTGFIRETMVHTLKTLIENREILLSVMQVFINDPSADWVKMAKSEALRVDGNFDSQRIQWFPKNKILSGKDKMNGINPMEILSRELESSSIPNDYKNALLNMINSDSQSSTYKRSKLPKFGITPNQQVDCLLDLSTDEHILGKAYSGLELWV